MHVYVYLNIYIYIYKYTYLKSCYIFKYNNIHIDTEIGSKKHMAL